MFQQIVIRHLEKPRAKDVEKDIEWVCDSLGFSSGRDIEDVSIRIFRNILERIAMENMVSSESIADDLDITQSRVNHHIRNLMDAGMLFRYKKLIALRGGSLKSAVEELKKDSDRIFEDLIRMADEIDHAMNLKHR